MQKLIIKDADTFKVTSDTHEINIIAIPGEVADTMHCWHLKITEKATGKIQNILTTMPVYYSEEED